MPGGKGQGDSGRGMGQGGGRGMGGGSGRGGGRGRMGGAGLGAGGECVCPKCGAKTPHTLGTPCTSIKCPQCGVMMTR